MKLAFISICLFIVAMSSVYANESKYGLPSDAVVIEEQSLQPQGYGDRTLILWMMKPERHPNEYSPDDSYTCPDKTRGSYYSGPTRVSLINAKTKTSSIPSKSSKNTIAEKIALMFHMRFVQDITIK
jgi:hypothetical protein